MDINTAAELEVLTILQKTCRMIRVGGDPDLAEAAARWEEALTGEAKRLQPEARPSSPKAIRPDAHETSIV